MNLIKDAFKDESKFQMDQREFVEDAKKYHGARSYSFFEAYLMERERKNLFILENIVAEELFANGLRMLPNTGLLKHQT